MASMERKPHRGGQGVMKLELRTHWSRLHWLEKRLAISIMLPAIISPDSGQPVKASTPAFQTRKSSLEASLIDVKELTTVAEGWTHQHKADPKEVQTGEVLSPGI